MFEAGFTRSSYSREEAEDGAIVDKATFDCIIVDSLASFLYCGRCVCV